jgi:CheY-like chemotaxis protein/curved DNA-binding protein CbpA
MGTTVLCADADRHFCRIVSRALGAEGYRVAVAHDGDAALQAVRGGAPGIALIEWSLPGRDGLALLEAIRALGGAAASMPALLMTGVACSRIDVERARALGAADVLAKPIALEDLLSQVSRLRTRPSAEAAAARAEPRARAAKPARLRGTLEELPFPALLHEVHGLRASGVLVLRSGNEDKIKQIQLLDGRPAAVSSNAARERLGEWLLRTKRISEASYTESIRRMRRGEGRQGEILVAMQVLSETALADALQQQAEEKLFEIFEWPDGSFELALGAQIERASALTVTRSPADVIRVGVHTRFPIERIDAVLRRHLEHAVIRSANPFYKFQEIELGAEEKTLLEEGRRPIAVEALLERTPAVRRGAYVLLETGLLELREGEAVRTGGHAARVRLHPNAQTSGTAAPKRAAPARPAAPSPRPSAPAAPAPSAARPPPAPSAARPPAPSEARAPSAAPAPPAAAAAAPAPEDHAHFAADRAQRASLATLVEQVRIASPFAKLGLGPDADENEIRAAYTQLAKKTHPDRWSSASHAVRELAEEAFREITRAYEALSDPERLAAYRRDPNRDAKDARALAEGQRALAAEQEFQKGEGRLRAHDWPGALAHFERAVELYPDEGEYLAYCGWAHYLTHGHEPDVMRRAFELVKRGAKLAPNREKPWLFLGRLSEATGRLDLAERMFARAIDRRPDSIEAMRALRLLQMRKPKPGLIGRILRRKASGKTGARGDRS